MGSQFGDDRYRRSENERWGGERRGGREGGQFGSGYGSFRGGQNFDRDREENYFGSGRQQFGDGYTGTDRERGAGRFGQGYDEDEFSSRGGSSYGRGGGEYRNTYGSPGSFGRRDFSGSDPFSGRRSNDQGERQFGRQNYGQNFPESEGGYQARRGNDQDRGWWDRASDEVSSWFGDDEAARRREMDERNQECFAAKGRGNYSRSDERITEDINDRLTDDYFLDASDIDVSVQSGEVTLTGTVDNRRAKRRAEDIAESVSGVKNVENRIRVNQSFYRTGSFGNTTTSDTETSQEIGRGKTA